MGRLLPSVRADTRGPHSRQLVGPRAAGAPTRDDADSSAEVVLAAAPMEPLALIEDELLLALPFAPRHPDGACTSA